MTESETPSLDDLIARLRERAADPERRVEARGGASGAEVRSAVASFGAIDLTKAFASLRSGQIDPGLLAKAETFVGQMAARKMPSLPAPASAAALDAAERDLGVPLPVALRRIYLEVADGGFGPAGGLMPLGALARAYRELRKSSPGPEGCEWPERLLPVVDQDGGYTCVEAATGRVVLFDPEELLEEWDPDEPDERAAKRGWKRSFRELAPTVESWLSDWLTTPTFEERMAKRIAQSNIEEARRARARIAAMTPEERKAMGLPEVGWERVVWGGLGLDPEP